MIITLYHITKAKNEKSIKQKGLSTKYQSSESDKGFWKTVSPGIYLTPSKIHRRQVPEKYIAITVKIDHKDLYMDESDIRWRLINYILKLAEPQNYKKLNKRKYIYPKFKNPNKILEIYKDPNNYDVFNKVKKEFNWLHISDKYINDLIRYTLLAELYVNHKDKAKDLPKNWLIPYRNIFKKATLKSQEYVNKNIKQLIKDDCSFISFKDIGFKNIPKIISIEEIRVKKRIGIEPYSFLLLVMFISFLLRYFSQYSIHFQ